MKKKLLKAIPIVVGIVAVGALIVKFANEIKSLISAIYDSIESIRKSVFKVYVSKRIDLKTDKNIDLDQFCDSYVTTFEKMATNNDEEENTNEEGVYEISED